KSVIADAANAPLLQAAKPNLAMVERWYGIGGASGPFAPSDALGADAASSVLPAPHADADASLVMIHTAAVGGRPRGALLSHANLLAGSVHVSHFWAP